MLEKYKLLRLGCYPCSCQAFIVGFCCPKRLFTRNIKIRLGAENWRASIFVVRHQIIVVRPTRIFVFRVKTKMLTICCVQDFPAWTVSTPASTPSSRTPWLPPTWRWVAVQKNVSIRDRDGLESVKMMSGIIGREIQKCSSFAEVDEIEIKKLFIFWRYRLSLFIRHAQ
jgi:hypothetical protein